VNASLRRPAISAHRPPDWTLGGDMDGSGDAASILRAISLRFGSAIRNPG